MCNSHGKTFTSYPMWISPVPWQAQQSMVLDSSTKCFIHISYFQVRKSSQICQSSLICITSILVRKIVPDSFEKPVLQPLPGPKSFRMVPNSLFCNLLSSKPGNLPRWFRTCDLPQMDLRWFQKCRFRNLFSSRIENPPR